MLPVLPVSADPLIKRAQEAEAAGNAPIAARLYSDWLHAYPGAPGSAKIFSAYFRVERDFVPLREESRAFLAAGKGCPGAADEFLRIARLFAMAGMLEESRDAYLAASAEGATDSALLSAALLSVEMNDAAALTQALSRTEGATAKSLLAALASLQAGDYESARVALLAVAAAAGDQDLAVKTLWVLYRAGTLVGDAAASSVGSDQLGSRFPGSPEAAMAAAGGPTRSGKEEIVRPVVSPFEALLVPSVAPGAATSPSASPPVVSAAAAGAAAMPEVTDAAPPTPAVPSQGAGSGALYAVQAGSFQVKENADYLAADLVKKGFAPAVVQDTLQGKDRFRVFAGTGLGGDDARALLARLTKAGYSGFLAATP